MDRERIVVGMADLNVCKNPNYLTTIGLGSCVGIALYDPGTQIAGLAHSMLPSSQEIKAGGTDGKFVDTAVEALIYDMMNLGASLHRMKAKLVGGAQMFAFDSQNESLRIGDRNIEASREYLHKKRIPIVAEDVGSNYGRTVEFYADTGLMLVKSIGHGEHTI